MIALEWTDIDFKTRQMAVARSDWEGENTRKAGAFGMSADGTVNTSAEGLPSLTCAACDVQGRMARP